MHEHSLLEGVLEVLASVGALVAKLLLDTHELVVLGSPLRAARGAGLDLSRPEADNEVRDGGVLRLARTVRHHHAPPLSLGHLASLDRLRDRPDLVHLEEEGVARLLLETGGDARGVRHQKVIAHNLDLAHLGGHLGVRLPVVLVVRVLDSHHGVVLDEALVHFEHLVAIKVVLGLRGLVLEVKVVLAVLAELRGGNVHADLDLAGVTRVGDGLHEKVEPLLVLLDVGGEAALVADVARVHAVLLLDHSLQRVVHLNRHADGLLERLGADRADHELLHGEAVAGVGATVDHVHPGDRHDHLLHTSEVGEVLVEGDALLRGAGLGHGERDGEDGVSAEHRLVGRAVDLDHFLVDALLVGGVHALEGRRDLLLDVLHRLDHTLAEVASLVVIAKLARLVDPRRSPRGDLGTEGADVGGEVHLDRRVASRVEHLAGDDRLDAARPAAQGHVGAEHAVLGREAEAGGGGREGGSRRGEGRRHACRMRRGGEQEEHAGGGAHHLAF
mmetsp:Transcript_39114/g.92556  ORF Transcript_39114/g.92556 Transcript_39114/m.92556 type:complete len:501 (+) Transcript_39114:284-1786(+)